MDESYSCPICSPTAFGIVSVPDFGYPNRYIREGDGTPLQYFCLENPWTEEPARLQSMGSQRVGHNWTTSLSLFAFMHWRRKWQPTPVFLPGESQGRGSLVGCRLWGRTESDMTEATKHTPWKESYDQPRQHIKKQRHYFANKDPSSQSYGFSSRHVWMWDLDYKENWALKNWCF